MASRSRQTRLPGLEPNEPLENLAPAESRDTEPPVDDSLPETMASTAADIGPLTAAEPIAADEPAAARGTKPPKSLRGKTVYVVDSHSLIFQVFHALPPMASPHGEPVGAVFGFTRDVMFLLEQKKPDYLFCAFDVSGPTFRDAMGA
jgi:5'-3' exonuclease, N-terminal resolvase-like domain